MDVHLPRCSVEPKIKPFPLIDKLPSLLWITQLCPAILGINWIFQGMRGMDGKELSFRLGLSTLIAIAVAVGGEHHGLSASWSVLLGWLAAHSTAFLLNGQFWVCARYCRLYRRGPSVIDRYVAVAVTKLVSMPWLDGALMIGSQGLGTGTRTDRSDIDLRLLFPSGIGGWLRCNALMLRWRTVALCRMIPLDLYGYDHAGALVRFNQKEPLFLILDRRNHLVARYPHRRWTSAI